MKLLVINPGSTSTKVSFFEDEIELWCETQRYDSETMKKFQHLMDQEVFRYEEIGKTLRARGINIEDIDVFVARGGLLRPIESGTYGISPAMIEELKNCKWGEHASNLGAPIAMRFAQHNGKPAYVVDPVVVDELAEVARLSGMPELPRKSIFHALNQKAVARLAAAKRGGRVEDYNFIVCHMGGGVSVGAHKKGRVVDVNDALGGEGPMSPERAGSVSALQLVEFCFSGEYSLPEIKKMLVGNGGFVAYVGTNDCMELEDRARSGDKRAKLVLDSFCYQIGKSIGACAVALEGRVDSILLTGGLAHSEGLCTRVAEKISWIAPVEMYPGEDEMSALALGVLRVMKGQEAAKQY